MKFVFNPFTSNFDITASSPSDISGGTPLTVAGFDSSGILESIPNWNIESVLGGMYINIIASETDTGATRVINNLVNNIQPSADLTTQNYQGLQNYNYVTGPFNTNSVIGINNGIQINNTGTHTYQTLLNQTFGIGDGTNISSSTSNTAIRNDISVNNAHTTDTVEGVSQSIIIQPGAVVNNSLNMFNGNLGIDGVIQTANLLALSSNLTAALGASSSITGINLYEGIDGEVDGVTAITSNLDMKAGAIVNQNIYGFGIGLNSTAGATINSYTALNTNSNIVSGVTVTGGLSQINAGLNVNSDVLTGGAGINNVNVSTQIAADTNYINGYSHSSIVNSPSAITNGFIGFQESSQFKTGSSANYFTGIGVFPTFETGSTINTLQMLNISPNVDNAVTASIVLAQMNFSGATGSSPQVTGLNVDVSNITSPNRKTALQAAGGSFYAYSQLTTLNSIGVDSLNSIIPQLTIQSGSPITGTSVFGANFANLLVADDDFAAGPLGFSLSSVAFVGNMTVASGKTVDGVSFAVSGSQVAGDGTYTDLVMYDAIGTIPGTGTPTVTNQYMFRGKSLVPGIPTNNWGISIEDSVAENYFKKSLAIDTSTKKVTNSSVALEIGAVTKAARLSVQTTTERNALTALSGMTIFNSTTSNLEYYNGSSWATTGPGNAITALTGDVTATGPGSVAATIANGAVTTAKIASSAVTATELASNAVTTVKINNAAVDLTTKVTGVLPLANGGTNKNMTAVSGGVVYTDSDSMEVTSAGTSGQYLKSNGSSAPSFASFTAPTIQKFTSGSGTYTTPANTLYIRVRMVGGGGGGSGGGTSAGAGGNGGATTFGSSLLNAGGGLGAAASSYGGAGGSASLGTGPIGTAVGGGEGAGTSAGTTNIGGQGGNSPFFSGGGGSVAGAAGHNGQTNTGGGGAGGGSSSSTNSGAGGGSGGAIDALISSPSATYSYAVGSGGSAGTAGTNGTAGGAGAAGYIEVTEYYQ